MLGAERLQAGGEEVQLRLGVFQLQLCETHQVLAEVNHAPLTERQ